MSVCRNNGVSTFVTDLRPFPPLTDLSIWWHKLQSWRRAWHVNFVGKFVGYISTYSLTRWDFPSSCCPLSFKTPKSKFIHSNSSGGKPNESFMYWLHLGTTPFVNGITSKLGDRVDIGGEKMMMMMMMVMMMVVMVIKLGFPIQQVSFVSTHPRPIEFDKWGCCKTLTRTCTLQLIAISDY